MKQKRNPWAPREEAGYLLIAREKKNKTNFSALGILHLKTEEALHNIQEHLLEKANARSLDWCSFPLD